MHDLAQHKLSWHEVMLHVLEMLRTPEPRGNCGSQGVQARGALLSSEEKQVINAGSQGAPDYLCQVLFSERFLCQDGLDMLSCMFSFWLRQFFPVHACVV